MSRDLRRLHRTGVGAFPFKMVLATAAALTVAHFYSRDLVQPMLPLLSKALGLIAADFKIVAIELFTDPNTATSIRVLAKLEHTLVLNGRAIVPTDESMMLVTTAVGGVLQPVLVALVLALAWPARAIEMALRLAIAALLLLLVLFLDTPMSIAASFWSTQLRMHDPGAASPLVWWNIFLNGGGRLALGLIAGVLSIGLAQRLAPRPQAAP